MNAVSTKKSHCQLTDIIRQEIEAANGYITFARFMQMALYTPNLGYYSRQQASIGTKGDFLTAPEISPLFAKAIAKQCIEIFESGINKNFLEIGAGSGILACDLLSEFDKQNIHIDHYYILEISQELKRQQKQLLQKKQPHLINRIIWLDHLPEKFDGIIFANEVMDALPVHCFRIEEQIFEKCVAWQEDHFIWKLVAATNTLADKALQIKENFSLPLNYESEINLQLPSWITTLSHALDRGVILLFDYGYGTREFYHPDRHQGTLMCYYQQQRHDNPLINVGSQDITAHVDFTLAATAGVESGLSVLGYTTQASFLLASGILDNPELSYQDKSAIKKLMLPSQMGEAIKTLALSKNFDTALSCFNLFDRRKDL